MALDYAKCAKEIYECVGKRENLVSAAHCATRLRLVTVDNKKVDIKVLENIEGVKGVFESNGQLQLIIGTGTVNKVYDEFLKVSGMAAATKDDVKAAAAAKQPLPKKMIKALGDVFVPILPAIVAAGLMMGLVEALGQFFPSFAGSDIYSWMDLVANTAIVYLPVLVAVSAARVFGGNIFLGGTIGLLLMHMNLLSAWTAASDPSQIQYWHILCFNIRQVNYQGHIIPIIIAIWLMCQIEKKLHKIVPEMIDLFVTPLVTVFATAFLAMTIIGPVFIVVEDNILAIVKALLSLPLGIGSFVCGAIYPLTVVCGIHHMFNVLEAGMIAESGRNIWLPVSCSANFAMCMSCVAVFVKAKNVKTKSLALPAGLSASLGITEPAIFGINLRFVKPLVCGMVGAAFGAAVGSLIGVYGSSYGVTGIPGFLITTGCTVQYTIMLLIAGSIAFILTFILWKEETDEAAAAPMNATAAGAAESRAAMGTDSAAADTAEAAAEELLSAAPAEQGKIYVPIEGNVIPREEIPDETFAAGVLGDGVGIDPAKGILAAPCDGEISTVAETGHAIGISAADDMEILIHVGVDTVKMNGDGFKVFVAEGDKVQKGQKLMEFDIEKIRAAGFSPVTAFLLTNSDDYDTFRVLKTGEASIGDEVMSI
ncbi:MAG: glucose PTS transporter subunit IIA [Eubacteriales bacterium]|nr:glucose PTS transporter subunit IIA [Eubacteriales bacterium]